MLEKMRYATLLGDVKIGININAFAKLLEKMMTTGRYINPFHNSVDVKP